MGTSKWRAVCYLLEVSEDHDATAANQAKRNTRCRIPDSGRRGIDPRENMVVGCINGDVSDVGCRHVLEPRARRCIDYTERLSEVCGPIRGCDVIPVVLWVVPNFITASDLRDARYDVAVNGTHDVGIAACHSQQTLKRSKRQTIHACAASAIDDELFRNPPPSGINNGDIGRRARDGEQKPMQL